MSTQVVDQIYETEINAWRATMDARLRRDDGWLTLAGLYWLHEGENTVGSTPTCEILLPETAPDHLGTIHFHDRQAALIVTSDNPITVDGSPTRSAALRNDADEGGPSIVAVGNISFFVIKREDHYGIRVRDANSEARNTFTGRKWFPLQPEYHLTARFIAHPTARTLIVINSVGLPAPMENPGYVEFELDGQVLSLQAFAADEDQLWFVFKDASSGKTTYGTGRFLYGTLSQDGLVDLDFNRAYNPPCSFTVYATCPLPPRENILPVAIEAGERLYR
jgi:uncharacterized protein (DUF1684 family)